MGCGTFAGLFFHKYVCLVNGYEEALRRGRSSFYFFTKGDWVFVTARVSYKIVCCLYAGLLGR